jgi:hypothetical protein
MSDHIMCMSVAGELTVISLARDPTPPCSASSDDNSFRTPDLGAIEIRLVQCWAARASCTVSYNGCP